MTPSRSEARAASLYDLAMDVYWAAQQNDEGDTNATLKAIAAMIASSEANQWKEPRLFVPDIEDEPSFTGRGPNGETRQLTLPGV